MRSLDDERMKSVPMFGKLKPRLRLLCFLLFFTALSRLSCEAANGFAKFRNLERLADYQVHREGKTARQP
jgi:hypothetical protein